MTCVSGSSCQACMKSISLRSALLPRLMKFTKPTSVIAAQSRMAVPSAPDWVMMETLPRGGISLAKDALHREIVLMMPRQLGPTIRMPYCVAICFTSFSSRAPSGPTSLNPAEMITRFLMPFSPHSRAAPGTSLAGMTMTARSTGPGTSSTLL